VYKYWGIATMIHKWGKGWHLQLPSPFPWSKVQEQKLFSSSQKSGKRSPSEEGIQTAGFPQVWYLPWIPDSDWRSSQIYRCKWSWWLIQWNQEWASHPLLTSRELKTSEPSRKALAQLHQSTWKTNILLKQLHGLPLCSRWRGCLWHWQCSDSDA